MDRNSIYYRQVQLLMQVLPFVAAHDCFALKGGTAINLFVRDFPRLSVDIDLVFLPMMDRDEALQTITSHLEQIAGNLTAKLQDVTVIRSATRALFQNYYDLNLKILPASMKGSLSRWRTMISH
ncbi:MULTISPECIES: nucleotidyl transferase AbiEii/AbiGii toxin family protein [Pseudidiomarina]|uniref:Nucleotidyltransferase AbiEii toxin of type IV toxin-antitoxin system n=2 Tax=Pseudidiomarina TaxID=2800384 RepID=A0A368US60_9GAMM|nr:MULTISPECIES: nucleotidyl transferase AbiEii/AbiGii toxin family protein [Pseudidiomarina]PWW07932.1 nucleotidyltransferase AbiEii toxin of type IV toxin-antitoxin system [Pseudidiomarina maritima]RBP90199.1 nucleotidyltransferase AbiEii toxin of type IV toxin-antitoxin system [Pseudidiomarina tainanensis]RCW31687.1 nucleotidyltransferase AbiEii toxin of type IV toxin-antitoxin system [Pseudidiomarina tainanensis]